MLFKDQAQSLVSKWESLRDEDDLETLAAQTAVSLSAIQEVPSEVLDALDRLLDREYEKLARSINTVVRFLRALAEDRTVSARRL